MTCPPLALVQARIGSTRLPRKMLLPLGGKPLVCWATQAAIDAFGVDNVVATVPASAANNELSKVLEDMGVRVHRWEGDEADVLGRLLACARMYRWDSQAVVVRVTPDDPFKSPDALRRVAAGCREPVELGGEAMTLEGWTNADKLTFDSYFATAGIMSRDERERERMHLREHLTALFDCPPPPCPPGVWTVDTSADYDRAKARAAEIMERKASPVSVPHWPITGKQLIGQMRARRVYDPNDPSQNQYGDG